MNDKDAPEHDDEAQDRWERTDPKKGSGWFDDDWPWAIVTVALVSTFVLGVLASLVVVLTWTNVTDDEQSADDATLARGGQLSDQWSVDSGADDSAADDSGSDDSAADDSGVAKDARSSAGTRLSRCVRAAKDLDGPLAAAKPSLDQWAVHIDAMNQLVVGEITLQQATAFWERTRVGAQRRVGEFRDAMTVLRKRGLDCPSPAHLAKGARRLPGCARQVEAQAEVLREAGRSIKMWEHHVHQMDMLRLGQLTPEEATSSWMTMWRRGARELDEYRTSARKAQSLDACG